MKGISSKHIALKVDVTRLKNILFAGMSVHLSQFQPGDFVGWGSEGVKISCSLKIA